MKAEILIVKWIFLHDFLRHKSYQIRLILPILQLNFYFIAIIYLDISSGSWWH
jgi:hypothetical protein